MVAYKTNFVLVIAGLVMLLSAGFGLLINPPSMHELVGNIMGYPASSFDVTLAVYIGLVTLGVYGLSLSICGLFHIFVEVDQYYLAKRKRAAGGEHLPKLAEEQLQLQDKAWFDTLTHGKNLLGL